MDEAQEILLTSLNNSGVSLPIGVSNIQTLNPNSLVSICAQSLNLIHNNSLSFPDSLPESRAERFKICTDIASAVTSLGYRGEISFHQFLYPSEDDSYKLIRFLVERLSGASGKGESFDKEKIGAKAQAENSKSEASQNDMTKKLDNRVVDQNDKKPSLLETAVDNRVVDQKDEPTIEGAMEGLMDSRNASTNRESVASGEDPLATALTQSMSSLQKQSSKRGKESVDTQSKEKMPTLKLTAKALEFQSLEDGHDLLKATFKMRMDDQKPTRIYINELNKNVSVKPVEEEKMRPEVLVHTQNGKEKLPNMKEVELVTEAVILEIRKREKEISKLSTELEKQPKVASRRSYIQRITEITKNSRKQDADIERILKETRELQMESNSIQERLHRAYAVVDETLFRYDAGFYRVAIHTRRPIWEARKDPVREQAYNLLTSVHGSFEQISEKIIATDRLRREISEQETKVAALATRSLNPDKLQADLDAIRKENELLEK
ncbi:hypothetical protein GIB67_001055 [Kingdonia uniflora]|uniref:Coiled-coil domain-containing protein 22 homolog n=1 Tax=Kingdonia uniflora TaxID=39325 RepID=A0A7J7MG80_9MAGN|nr:hypothetical protein GIB67_001055 [Kingdonia uniflora]